MDEWSNSCRSCLKKAVLFSHFIYEHISAQQYFYCTSVEVKRDDEFPKAVCGDCYNLINKFIAFKTRCIQSENKLLGLSKGALVKDEPSSDIKVKNEIVVEDTWDEKSEDEKRTESCSLLEIKIEAAKKDVAEEVIMISDIDDVTDTDGPVTDLGGEDFEDHIEATKVSATEGAKPTYVTARNMLPKNFKCEQCNRKFAFKERLEGHMLRHEGKTVPIQCKECNKTFTAWETLRRHIESCHTLLSFKDLTCQVCSKVCKTPDTLRVHLRTHKERLGRVCDECGKTFKNNVTFKAHLQTHTPRERKLPCVHCGKKYITKTVLANHIHRKHSDRQLICDHCSLLFTNKGSLIKHMKLHSDHTKYKCFLCPSSFHSRSFLARHRRTHGEKPFSCSLCPKSYTHKFELKIHGRVHTGERPYKCSLCEMTFPRRTAYTRHVRRHNKT